MTHTEKVALAMAWYDSGVENRAEFQTLIESLLAQPEQEPHGWYIDGYGAVIGTAEPKSVRVGEWLPWYTSPPQRKPLTKEEMFEAIRPLYNSEKDAWIAVEMSEDEYRAIEAAHGIKE